MNSVLEKITVSPVNMEERKALGIKAGDTVKIHQKIQDKGKTRIQIFDGVVLARKHGNEAGATFTVRKITSGVGVEKIYPLYSPLIDKIEIVKRAKVRRAKLYYIREKVAREIKRQMRRMKLVAMATESGVEADARIAKEEAEKAEAEAKAQEAEVAKNEEAAVETEEVSTEETKAEASDNEEAGAEVETEEPKAEEDSTADADTSETENTEETKKESEDTK